MNNLVADFIEDIKTVDSIDELIKLANGFAKTLGFDYVAYGHKPHFPLSNQAPVIINNYPEKWQSIYEKQDYIQVDPLVIHGVQSTSPLIWSTDNNFQAVPNMREELSAFDLKQGWSQSTRSQSGISMLTFTGSNGYINKKDFSTITPTLMWFTCLFNEALERHILKASANKNQIQLTPREADIMRWTADGKTSGEIALILSITERTVNFHLTNCMTKLNATNRISAVVKAIALGHL